MDALGKAQKGAGAAAEVGVICEELEAHAVDMRKSVDNLVSLVAGSGAPSGPSNSDSPVRPAPQAV